MSVYGTLLPTVRVRVFCVALLSARCDVACDVDAAANGATMPAPKGMRNGQPYYGRVWCAENRKQEVERLRPARHQGVDSMFTVLHKS